MAEKESNDPVAFERYALTRAEYISAIIHLYRGEMHRALTWRTRLDMTTNWAVFTTGAMLSFLFTRPDHHHVVALLGIALVFFMLTYEARRFRYFDAWRSRVRKLEVNFYAPLLRRDLMSPVENWSFVVAEDLLTPRFKIGFLVALRARLIRNYIPIFLVLYAAWITKLTIHPNGEELEKGRYIEIVDALGYTHVGPIPSPAVNALAFGFAAFLILVALFARPPRTKEQRWWSEESDESMDEIS